MVYKKEHIAKTVDGIQRIELTILGTASVDEEIFCGEQRERNRWNQEYIKKFRQAYKKLIALTSQRKMIYTNMQIRMRVLEKYVRFI